MIDKYIKRYSTSLVNREMKVKQGPAWWRKWLSARAPLRQPGVRRFRSWVRTDAPLCNPCCGGVPYKVEEDGHGC